MGIRDWFATVDTLEPGTDEYKKAANGLENNVDHDELTRMRQDYSWSRGPQVDRKGLGYIQLETGSEVVYLPIAEYSNGEWEFINDELDGR